MLMLLMAVHATDPHDSKGPEFVIEPPHRLEFMNRAGGRLDCVATGNPPPSIEWLDQENTPLSPIQKVRANISPASIEYIFPATSRCCSMKPYSPFFISSSLIDTAHPLERIPVLSSVWGGGLSTGRPLGFLQVCLVEQCWNDCLTRCFRQSGYVPLLSFLSKYWLSY